MDFLSQVSFGLSRFGVEYAIMGLEASVIAYLYKKLIDAKDEQVKAAKEENERNEQTRESLQRTTDNIFTFVQSHTSKSSANKKSK